MYSMHSILQRKGRQLLQYNKNMDIEYSETQLSNKLGQILISTSNNYSTQPRQSNTLIAAQMPFELDPSHIKQYNKMYLNRLSVLGKRIPLMKIYRVQQVQAKYGTISIIGIFKRIQNKRVRAFEKNYEQYYGKATTIYDINDTLEIEDDSGKIKFILAPGCTMNGRIIKPTDLPYGVVLGLTGRNNDEKMQFIVQKITLPSLPNQKPINNKTNLNRKTLIMSAPSLQNLKQTFTQIFDVGSLPLYNSIKSIIILGFSQKLTANQYRQLDNLLARYSKQINIHIMPNQAVGEIYPQKPIHPILFSNSWHNLSLVNNPQIFYTNDQQIEGNLSQVNYDKLPGSLLVCSGQNIKDLVKNCSFGQSSLDTMQSILEYSHLAPSSPFSLKCEMMPQDYLVINQLPHVFVAGGCQKTNHRQWQVSGKKVKLVSIKHGSNILLDIDTYKINQLQVKPASTYQNS